MLLLNTTSTDQDICRRSSGRFRLCLSALEDMQQRWKRAADAILLLRELANRWSVVHVLPIHLSGPLVRPPQSSSGGGDQPPVVHVESTLFGNYADSSIDMMDHDDIDPDTMGFDFGKVYLTMRGSSASSEPWGFENDHALHDLAAYPDFSQMFNHMWPDNAWG